jgi:hypothetical protein
VAAKSFLDFGMVDFTDRSERCPAVHLRTEAALASREFVSLLWEKFSGG